MQYCPVCGKQLPVGASFCPNCGNVVEDAEFLGDQDDIYRQPTYGQPDYQQPAYQQPVHQPPAAQAPATVLIVAKVFMIISCVLTGWMIISLAWTIPMTVVYCKKVSSRTRIGTGFKVCTLLFVSLIAGILMLCDETSY